MNQIEFAAIAAQASDAAQLVGSAKAALELRTLCGDLIAGADPVTALLRLTYAMTYETENANPLTGFQMLNLVAIVERVREGKLPVESARAIIATAIAPLSAEQIDMILAPLISPPIDDRQRRQDEIWSRVKGLN